MSHERHFHVAGINRLWNLYKSLNKVKGHNKGAQPQRVHNLPIPSCGREGGSCHCSIFQCFIYLSQQVQTLPTLFAPFQMGNWGTACVVWELEGNLRHGKKQMPVFHHWIRRPLFIPSKLWATPQEVGDLGSLAGRSPLNEEVQHKAENSSQKKSPLKTILLCGIWLKPATLATNRGKKNS